MNYVPTLRNYKREKRNSTFKKKTVKITTEDGADASVAMNICYLCREPELSSSTSRQFANAWDSSSRGSSALFCLHAHTYSYADTHTGHVPTYLFTDTYIHMHNLK